MTKKKKRRKQKPTGFRDSTKRQEEWLEKFVSFWGFDKFGGHDFCSVCQKPLLPHDCCVGSSLGLKHEICPISIQVTVRLLWGEEERFFKKELKRLGLPDRSVHIK